MLICVGIAFFSGVLAGCIITNIIKNKEFKSTQPKPPSTIEEKLEYQAHLGVVHRDWERKHDPFRGN